MDEATVGKNGKLESRRYFYEFRPLGHKKEHHHRWILRTTSSNALLQIHPTWTEKVELHLLSVLAPYYNLCQEKKCPNQQCFLGSLDSTDYQRCF